MKGIVLAGGSGTRLFPLTKATNKHLLPVGRYPMIYYPLFRLWECGIRDVLIVTGREHLGDFARLLGGGEELGLRLTYRVQARAGGIADALRLGESFCGSEKVVVLLGDNIFQESIAPFARAFGRQGAGARVLLTTVPGPEKHQLAVAEISGGEIISIREKPQQTNSDMCVTGIYMYDSQVFEIIRTLAPSARGELEITDVNKAYLAKKQLFHDVLPGWWEDAGTLGALGKIGGLLERWPAVAEAMDQLFAREAGS